MIRSFVAVIFALPLLAADPWTQLDDSVHAALRWRGGSPAALLSEHEHWHSVFNTPKLRTAACEVVAAWAAKDESVGAVLDGAIKRGFGWADLEAVVARDMGFSLALRATDDAVACCGGAWATIPDPLWKRLLALLSEQVDAKLLTRHDLVRDNHAIIVVQHDDVTWAVLREDNGRCWLQVGNKMDMEAVVDRLMHWYVGHDAGTTLVRRATEAKVIGQLGNDTLIETAINVHAIIDLLEQHAPAQIKMFLPIFDAIFGLDSMGLAGGEIGVTLQHTTVSLGLKTTGARQGILHWVDTPPRPVAAPAWIPADAIKVAQFNLDLSSIIDGLRTAAAGNPLLQGQFAQMENSIPAFTGGLTLQQIATALGGTFWFVDLPESSDELLAGNDRKAFVFELAGPTVFSRLLPLMNTLAHGRQIRFVTEQGAQGARFAANPQTPSPEFAIFIGAHHLVLGIGSNVASELLAAITRGDGAWSRTPYADKGLKQLPTHPLLHWSVEDPVATMRQLPDIFGQMLTKIAEATDNERLDKALNNLCAALPDADAMASTITGPSTAAIYDDAGVIRFISIQSPAMDK